MRKTASILSFLLALGFLAAFIQMANYDATHAAERTKEAFDNLHYGLRAEFEADLQASEARHTEERVYGILGMVAAIGGFALWPYDRKPAQRPEQQAA